MATFTGNRYMTKGIQQEIPLELQIILWYMIDDNIKKGLKMDYLQVFILKPFNKEGNVYQEIIHTQEVPQRKKRTVLNVFEKPISTKIFVIDSDSYVTMLFSHEY